MTEPTIYSHSRLASFEKCPKSFEYRYILKIPTDTEGIEAFVGKRVHEILERLYEFVDEGRIPGVDQVIHRYESLWDETFDEDRIRIAKTGTPVSFYHELGIRCLDNYYRRHYPFDADETLGLEERVVFDLDERGDYRMQGIIDRLVRTRDGFIEIHDYKTGKWVPSQKALDEDRQLALYQIGVQNAYGDDSPIRLVWHYVAKGQKRTSSRTSEQLEDLKAKTITLIDTIADASEYPTRTSNLCDWCEYKSICPEFSDGAAVAEAAETNEPIAESAKPDAPAKSPANAKQSSTPSPATRSSNEEEKKSPVSSSADPDGQLRLL